MMMSRRADRAVTIIGTIVILIIVSSFIGFACGTRYVDAAVIPAEVTSGTRRELIEGGGMPCVVAEKPPCAAENTEAEEITEEAVETPKWAVNGDRLNDYLQSYLYEQLEERGVAWYYETALCQIYQESRYNASAVNPNGLDMGLCQMRITYFHVFAKEAGLVEADIMNPIDSIYVYAYLMGKYLTEEPSIEMALSRYFTGTSTYNDGYVRAVKQWFPTLTREQ